MNAFAHTIFLTYAGLFPIVNPIGSAPLFLVLTQFCSHTERHTLAQKVAVNSFFLLLASLFVGSHVLVFFGISLPVLRIAGGLVVTAFGWRLLNAEAPANRPDSAPDAKASVKVSAVPDAFYPLTMPLTVGPGSMSVAVSLGSQRPSLLELPQLALISAGAVTGIIAMALSIYLCYRYAERIVSALGATGTNVVERLSAFILVCIGIQIIWSGWSQLTALPQP